jgi:ParB family transcriptional regulator, chromosome partitioning protein
VATKRPRGAAPGAAGQIAARAKANENAAVHGSTTLLEQPGAVAKIAGIVGAAPTVTPPATARVDTDQVTTQASTSTPVVPAPREADAAGPQVTPDPESVLVDIATVAAHPANPREKYGDLSELADSIEAVGLLEPILIVSAAAFLRAHPEYADKVPDTAEWVVLAGHRRSMAIRDRVALLANDPTKNAARVEKLRKVRATRNDQFAHTDVDDLVALAIENLHRLDFTPLEEAALFETMLGRGMSRAEIIEKVKKSKGHISKRLSLLELIPEIRAVLASGRLTLEIALEYAAEDEETQRAAWALASLDGDGIRPADALALHKQAEDRRQRAASARAQAAEAGVEIVDPRGLWGRNAAAHRLVDDEAVARAREAGQLAAALDETGTLYWVTTAAVDARPASDADAKAQAAEAGKARAEACRVIVGRKVSAADALRHGVDVRLSSVDLGAAQRLAHGWLRSAGIGPDIAGTARYVAAVYDSADTALRQQVAEAVALAVEELQVRGTTVWGPRHRTHLQRLITEGSHSPTAWELAQMDARSDETDET